MVQIKSLKAGEHLLSEGEISTEFYFLGQGIIRQYYIRKGQEISTAFYGPSQFVSAYESFSKSVPAKFFLQIIQDATLAVINQTTAAQLLSLSPKFAVLANKAMEDELIQNQNSIASLLILDPTERYLHLIENHPCLLQEVPQHQLATFLGLRPESLSRIRSRLRDQKK